MNGKERPQRQPSARGRWRWAEGYRQLRQEKPPGIQSASYDLKTLVRQGLLREQQLRAFQEATGLANFSWRMFYAQEQAVPNREAAIRRAVGFVIFMHGWDGTGAIWEHLPALVCACEPRLVALVPDVNGFGGSPFLDDIPPVELCDPPACIRAVEHWLTLLKLRSGPIRRKRVLNFVGHSMSGAALFYKTIEGWEDERYTLCAIAPALLCNDVLRKGFYKVMGVGIIAGIDMGALDKLKVAIAPRLIRELIGGASTAVRREHLRVFRRTSKGTLAQTFYALGLAKALPRRPSWDNFRVILGHRDRLVGLAPMLELLEELGLRSSNIRVVLGDHYLFSVNRRFSPHHAENRELVLQDILALHRWAAAR